MKITLGSLFSGLGGLDMGLEDALDASTLWQAECEPYPSALLRRDFPGARLFHDVSEVKGATASPVTVCCGGSPCQDISLTGPRLGLAGARSGLWFQFARVIAEIAPKIVVWENVGGALCQTRKQRGSLGFAPATRVMMDLDELGYDAWWTTCLAASVGAPHPRLRTFVVGWDRSPQAGVGKIPADHRRSGVRTVLDGSAWPARPGRIPNPGEPPRELRSGLLGGRDRKPRIMALGNCVVPQVGYAVGIVCATILRGELSPFAPFNGKPGTWGRHLAKSFVSLVDGKTESRGLFSLRGKALSCIGSSGRSRGVGSDPRCVGIPPSGVAIGGDVYVPVRAEAPIGAQACPLSGCKDDEGDDPFSVGQDGGLWPTATTRDHRSGKTGPSTKARGNSRPLSEVAAPRGVLNADWVDGLMGFRYGHTRLEPSTRPSRKAPKCSPK